MKNLLLLIGSMGLGFTLFFGGCYGLSKHIYNRTDCKQFNIDNIELRTGINIPAVLSSDCTFNEDTQTKTSSFVLDHERVVLADYLLKNTLQADGDYYSASDENANTKWSAVLDPETYTLDVSIEYR